MEHKLQFATQGEARAFALGLHKANDGNIHSCECNVPSDPNPATPWEVTWHNESRKPAELPEKNPPLTSAEYVAQGGSVCPVCRGDDRVGDEVMYDHGEKLVTRNVSCSNPDCEATWSECYELSGYDHLER